MLKVRPLSLSTTVSVLMSDEQGSGKMEQQTIVLSRNTAPAWCIDIICVGANKQLDRRYHCRCGKSEFHFEPETAEIRAHRNAALPVVQSLCTNGKMSFAIYGGGPIRHWEERVTNRARRVHNGTENKNFQASSLEGGGKVWELLVALKRPG